MKRVVWSCGMLATIALLLFPPHAALAQGVTSAALAERMTDASGVAVAGADGTVTNHSAGPQASSRSGADGQYFFENLAPGGPYVVEVHALGFGPEKSQGIMLTLNQRATLDFRLKPAAVELAGVTIEATANPLISTA